MRTALATLGAIFAVVGLAPAQERIGGHAYEKQESRKATLRHMLDLLVPEGGSWGDWHVLSPFPYPSHGLGLLAQPLPPEDELERMAHGGPGPDLSRTYVGKKELEVGWEPMGVITNRRVDLHRFEDPDLQDQMLCYLYTTVEAEKERLVRLTMGSDDGLRVWLNGGLIHDNDAARGMNPYDDEVLFHFRPGTNHVLFKITEGVGGWEFQINTRRDLAAELDAQLFYYLDRDFPPSREREHYRVMAFAAPEETALEVGGIAFLEDETPVVSTRRGDVWLVRNAYEEPPLDTRFDLFATGLHEPLGLAVRKDSDGEAIYCVQRGELTRLLDRNGDDVADAYECFSDDWGVSGNYHEFAFGPKFDQDGNAWVTLNVGFCGSLGKSTVPLRGWALKVTPEGEAIPVCDGLRSPNGMAAWNDGEMFYVDNQGDYVATNRLSHLTPGSWHGHPASLRWRSDLDGPADRPPRALASVWFPYRKMGQSAADIALDTTDGGFGPFSGQFFVGDQTLASVMRVDLEVVEGHYQGACFPFLGGLSSGVNRVAFAPDGSMIVGQTDRGWSSVGRKRHGLERVVYTGVEPFEILSMRALEDGFELEFTKPVEPSSVENLESWKMTSFTYEYLADYGAPEIDTKELVVSAVERTGPRTVRLEVSPLRAGYVHGLDAHGVRAKDTGEELLHSEAWYTLEVVPGRARRVAEERIPRLLFLTHSAGYEHAVVRRSDGEKFAQAERALIEAAEGRFEVTATKDCAYITAETLVHFDAVAFYTSGELAIDEEDRLALIEWVQAGGAFTGIHCAADTFHEFEEYREMLGADYESHPWHQEVRVQVVGPTHPACDELGEDFLWTDEIYQFSNYEPHPNRPLLRLDTTSVDASKGMHPGEPYDLAWCREWGDGRVFYTALGHRPDVWENDLFLDHVLDGVEWTLRGPEYIPPPPNGAIVLFDGSSTDAWQHPDGSAVQWRSDGVALEVTGGGNIVTKQSFGDCRIHLEFRPPPSPPGTKPQDRGNSGIYIQNRYELQVLDSHDTEPGLDTCGAFYNQKAPAVDATRAPGRWQSYDIRFRAPRFDASGKKTEKARVSVWQNGIQIHEDVELDGPTAGGIAEEVPMAPLLLQDHECPVRYRNVWVLPD